MYKFNVIKNNKVIQILKTDNKISNVLYKFNYIILEQVKLFEYNLFIK
jgi:hypothetical protein